MKLRKGFVSNSSSSSFIVAFYKIPNSIEELQEVLFGSVKSISIYDKTISSKYASKRVFNDMKNKGLVIDRKLIEDEIKKGYISRCSDYYDNYKDYIKRRNKKASQLTNDFLTTNEGANFFIFEYSDHNDTVMEHGDIFFRLPHIRVNKH